MKKKTNNKGFSLVELIVVMAIMAILAVTLAPKLSQYIDKSKQASDREVANTIVTAVKYALMDDSIYTNVVSSTSVDTDLANGLTSPATTLYDYNLAAGVDYLNSIYDINAAGDYIPNATIVGTKDAYFSEIVNLVGNTIKLKSKNVVTATKITVTITDYSNFKVLLDYDGDGTPDSVDYEVTSN